METSLRQLQGEEIYEALFSLTSYAFHASPPSSGKEEWLERVRGRKGMTAFAIFEDETPVSIAVSTPMTQNMRAKLYPVSAIWGVVTSPSARRKGYCKRAMAAVLATERESGKVFSNLYPFRESFYERLGYIAFPATKTAHFATSNISQLLTVELPGVIRLQLVDEAYEAYRSYLDQIRLHRHGMAFFDYGNIADAMRNQAWFAWAVFDGTVEGLMLYRLLGQEVGKFNFSVPRFYYQTHRARYLMLNWIARHVDQAENVELWLAEDEYPETWLADLEVKVEESSNHPAMNRILDVERLSGMDVREGSFSARIKDPLCPWNEGIWRFESRGGKLAVCAAPAADCELTIQGLTTLIAGVHDPADISFRGWGNPDESTQSILRGMFPKMRPYLHEYF